jgi:hypothetical protein
MYKAEQLNLFEIEAEDSLAVYGTDSIPFLVVTPNDTAMTPVTSPVTLSANVPARAETHTQSTSNPIPSGF